MSRSVQTNIANDNDPREARPQGDATGFRALLREQEMERRLQALEYQQVMQGTPMITAFPASHIEPHAPVKTGVRWGLMLALFLTLLSTLAAAYCFYSGQTVVMSVVALTAMVWSALWASFLSTENGNESSELQTGSSFIPETSIVIATIAGLAIWVLASREWGLPVSVSDGVAGFAGLTAITAALLRSRLSLLMSACAGLAWLTLYTQVPSINLFSIWLLPLLALIQLFIAGQDGRKISALLVLIGSHAWLFWVLNDRFTAGDISPLHIAALCMMIGLAHYRLGKAAGDAEWQSANLHVVFGWSLAVIGTVGLQLYWLGTEEPLWQNVSATPLAELTWQVVGAGCLVLIGIAGVIRMVHKQMTSIAVLFSLGAALAAAALFDQRGAISALVELELNMSATPLVGLMIGAAIFASAIAMCVNGARRKSVLMMLIGFAAIAVQLALLLQPQFWTPETGLVFVLCLFVSLGCAALFAADARPDTA